MTAPNPEAEGTGKLVTLTVVGTLAQADVVCTKLRADGIEAFLPDQATVSANPMYGGAIGGIRIQVRQEDLAHARELLATTCGILSRFEPVCPRCGSALTAFVPPHPWFVLLCLLLLGLPLLWTGQRMRCRACGTRWTLR